MIELRDLQGRDLSNEALPHPGAVRRRVSFPMDPEFVSLVVSSTKNGSIAHDAKDFEVGGGRGRSGAGRPLLGRCVVGGYSVCSRDVIRIGARRSCSGSFGGPIVVKGRQPVYNGGISTAGVIIYSLGRV
jgi:hypothetical protein